MVHGNQAGMYPHTEMQRVVGDRWILVLPMFYVSMATKKVCPKGVSLLPLWPEGEQGASRFHTPELCGESIPHSPEGGYGL